MFNWTNQEEAFHYLRTIIPVPKHMKAGKNQKRIKGKVLPGGTDQAACARQVSHVLPVLETALLQEIMASSAHCGTF